MIKLGKDLDLSFLNGSKAFTCDNFKEDPIKT